MNIAKYIKLNYDKLPKSTFDGQEVVIFKQIQNSDYGYGHHTYEGYGVDKAGNIIWCYSSGCSCNGSVSFEHRCTEKDIKTFKVEGCGFDEIDPKNVIFNDLEVSFNSY